MCDRRPFGGLSSRAGTSSVALARAKRQACTITYSEQSFTLQHSRTC